MPDPIAARSRNSSSAGDDHINHDVLTALRADYDTAVADGLAPNTDRAWHTGANSCVSPVCFTTESGVSVKINPFRQAPRSACQTKIKIHR